MKNVEIEQSGSQSTMCVSLDAKVEGVTSFQRTRVLERNGLLLSSLPLIHATVYGIHFKPQIDKLTVDNLNKKPSCCRETARCFVSLNISLIHSTLLEVV